MKVCTASHTLSTYGILSATNSITKSASASPSTIGCASTWSGSGRWMIPRPLEQSGGRHRGVEIEPGSERGAEREAQRFERRHVGSYYSSQSTVTPPTAVVTSMSRWRAAWS